MKLNINDEKTIKVVGIVTMVTGVVLSITESVLADKTMDRKISKNVSAQLRKRNGHGYSHR